MFVSIQVGSFEFNINSVYSREFKIRAKLVRVLLHTYNIMIFSIVGKREGWNPMPEWNPI